MEAEYMAASTASGENAADMLTKALCSPTLMKCISRCGLGSTGGQMEKRAQRKAVEAMAADEEDDEV